jgi:hypothetical protein
MFADPAGGELGDFGSWDSSSVGSFDGSLVVVAEGTTIGGPSFVSSSASDLPTTIQARTQSRTAPMPRNHP